ncbi:MAG TPA: PTS transporter subunit EIIC [Hydrogenispora sp.]|nr:PTS transporter subunit EIIC [Hydrogenispora sp.]
MNYQTIAKEILTHVGGEENIELMDYCATRLRLRLREMNNVDRNRLEKTKGVLGVNYSGNRVQIIIGSDVANVYKAFTSMVNLEKNRTTAKGGGEKSKLSVILDTIAGVFTPILPGITGAGMIKALLALFTAFNWISPETQTYYVLDTIADAAFYFIPVLLAYTAANRFKTNPYLAVALAGVLLHPNFTALINEGQTTIGFLGVPIRLASYGSSVIPIILGVWFMSYVERFADRVSPKVVKFFLKPLITLLIVAPVTLIILGPIGTIIGDYVAEGTVFLNDRVSFLIPTLMGAFSPLLVMFGMHYSLFPVALSAFAALGYEAILLPGMLAANIAQGAAALAVSIKAKDQEVKSLGRSAGLTALMGITEPAMYGINLRYKRPFLAVMIGGGVAGIFAGITKVKSYGFASPGLASLPIFIGDTFIYSLITIGISFALTFVLTWFFGIDEETGAESKKKHN